MVVEAWSPTEILPQSWAYNRDTPEHAPFPPIVEDELSYEVVPPAASAMLESLRGVGYSIETALADIVDNSLAAGARNVWVRAHFDPKNAWLSVLDDGSGMGVDELRQAMVLGGRGPSAPRAASDLGRFGLGMKTASFSQCRCLTVSSKKDGVTSTRRWDLDVIADKAVNDWRLLTEPGPGSELALADLGNVDAGTIVLWQRLDRVISATADSRQAEEAFLAALERVQRHLGMVFHRFLEGQSPSLRLFIARDQRPPTRVLAWDPFLSEAPATERSPLEPIHTSGGTVLLQGFVLPHKDRLTQAVYEQAAGPLGWTSQQGFYVYRNRRLLVAGDWLGLGIPRAWTKEEPHKLARLRLDFDSSADEAWTIDIKKSVARPPASLVPKLTALANQIRVRARQVFAHRGDYGPRAPLDQLARAWLPTTTGAGIRYRINRDHTAVRLALDEPSHASVERALVLTEQTVPVQRIWLDTLEQLDAPPPEAPSAELETIARALLEHLVRRVGLSLEEARRRLSVTDPFHAFPDTVSKLSLGSDSHE